MSIARDETETAAMIKTEAIPPSSLGRSGGAPDPSMVRAHKQADLSGSEAAEFEADDFRESDHDWMLAAEMVAVG
ncbi:cytochrome P450 family protein [Aspergillus luchuensis]|uniref:Cytochrome P450 family protein n=1 Tax=Aspergillus kawachii TaxID=1069201 RepID=A0A146FBM5_ASPKA|nr:cytochrome P450 family protein [Aspergillus luchuensis]